ncbi:unnamed protein product [Boreogadus saida]
MCVTYDEPNTNKNTHTHKTKKEKKKKVSFSATPGMWQLNRMPRHSLSAHYQSIFRASFIFCLFPPPPSKPLLLLDRQPGPPAREEKTYRDFPPPPKGERARKSAGQEVLEEMTSATMAVIPRHPPTVFCHEGTSSRTHLSAQLLKPEKSVSAAWGPPSASHLSLC